MLTGLVERADTLRYTPAGVPIVEFDLVHASSQTAGGFARDVRCEVSAQFAGEAAKSLAGKLAGATVTVKGFLAARSLRNPRLVLHVQSIEFEKV